MARVLRHPVMVSLIKAVAADVECVKRLEAHGLVTRAATVSVERAQTELFAGADRVIEGIGADIRPILRVETKNSEELAHMSDAELGNELCEEVMSASLASILEPDALGLTIVRAALGVPTPSVKQSVLRAHPTRPPTE